MNPVRADTKTIPPQHSLCTFVASNIWTYQL